MPRTAKRALKPYVERWLKELDDCFKTLTEWDSVTERAVQRKVLIHPAPAEHTGRLHKLVMADYSPLVSRAEAFRIEESGEKVPLARKEFPTDFYWSVIKKWDRWRKLKVVAKINEYVAHLREFWEREWFIRGGDNSPYTREWIHYENLLDAHRFVYRCEPGKKQMDEWKRRFPAVVVIQRIESGKAAQAADIKVLERWASTWCKEHVAALYDKLQKCIRKLDSRAENWGAPINELLSGTAELYAAALAQDIQARHQRAVQLVWRWEKRYGHQVSGYLRTLGNVEYIHQLREVMPLRRVGDPVLEQRERIRAAKQASAMRKRRVESLSWHDEDEA